MDQMDVLRLLIGTTGTRGSGADCAEQMLSGELEVKRLFTHESPEVSQC